MSEKNIGLMICLVGSILAIVVPPWEINGPWFFKKGWAFIGRKEFSCPVYNMLNFTYLAVELVVINFIGYALHLHLNKKS